MTPFNKASQSQFLNDMTTIRNSFRTVANAHQLTVTTVYIEYANYAERRKPKRKTRLSREDLLYLDRCFIGTNIRAKDFVLRNPDYIINETIPNSYKRLEK